MFAEYSIDALYKLVPVFMVGCLVRDVLYTTAMDQNVRRGASLCHMPRLRISDQTVSRQIYAFHNHSQVTKNVLAYGAVELFSDTIV